MKLVEDEKKESLDIAIAKRALALQIKGLMSLNNILDKTFEEVISLLLRIQGKIIVSGMGKSGHIAKKIAATLASTGSPAYFVHPAEASHGDLGMICKQDVVILLSNSGETRELGDIVNYSKRFDIPLIAIVRKSGSTIGRVADICLTLPDIPEISSVNVPTTSTSMMMALGDLIAICLLERRSFNKENYKIFHPGGKIGADLLKVKELMHVAEEVPLVTLDDKMSSVLLVMTSKKFGCAGVINDQRSLVGIITDGDLRRHLEDGLLNKLASEIMTPNPLKIEADELAMKALNIMNDNSITSLFVTREDGVVGIIHIHDCLRVGVK
jgi:arabinose-5-phosphate isomerase